MRTETAPVGGREQAELRLERLFAQHGRAVLAYAVRRATPDDAADIVAETFLVVWRRLDDLPEQDTRLWLYGVAHRVLANQQRSDRRPQRLADRLRTELPAVLDGVPTPYAHAGRVKSALARLRPEDREVLGLSAWEELTTMEIATVLGVSQVAVRSRLHRARRRLRGAMRRTRHPAQPTPHLRRGVAMTAGEVDAALAAANPLPNKQALRLALERTEIELIEETASIPVSPHRRTQPRRVARRRWALG